MNEELPPQQPPSEPAAFTSGDFAKAHLLREPLYAEDGALWEALLREEGPTGDYFRHIGLELVVDRPEGYAFLRQIEPDGDEKVPRLVHRRKLTYDATLLLVCLRDELNRFDVQTADQSRLYCTRRELHEMVSAFLPESHHQMRDVKAVDSGIEQLRGLGFLRSAGGAETYEVRRIVKARLGAAELEALKEKLKRHAEPGT
jgi:hypothetical protein